MNDFQHLENIKNTIEKMDKSSQIEILKIFKKYPNVKLNGNKSGVFINLSYLSSDIINEIDQYLNYIDEQENTLQQVESQKKEFHKTFFNEKTS